MSAEQPKEPCDIAGCLSEMLMRANEYRGVIVIAVPTDGDTVLHTWAAKVSDRLAMAKYLDVLITEDCWRGVKGEDG